MFEQSIEKWTKCSTFMDAYSTPDLTSSRFIRPAVKCIRAKIEKEPLTVDNIGKEHERLLSSPPTTLSVSDWNIDVKLRNLAT